MILLFSSGACGWWGCDVSAWQMQLLIFLVCVAVAGIALLLGVGAWSLFKSIRRKT